MPTQIDDCSRHKKEVAGITDMKQLAEMIGDLHYETLAELLDKLCDKIRLDAAKDMAGGRLKLANVLRVAASDIQFASINIDTAYQISKPFMEPKTKEV